MTLKLSSEDHVFCQRIHLNSASFDGVFYKYEGLIKNQVYYEPEEIIVDSVWQVVGREVGIFVFDAVKRKLERELQK